jgi:TonB-linked SusC/RagA family outer membrane protein
MKICANRQSPTVSQLLQGVSAGTNFEISNFEGFSPGATMDIQIRGVGSLNGGNPYILIDGIPGDINELNPDNIASISVLKDAAASAIYGARAPYGVILVTTKEGKKDEKLSVTYSGNVFLNTPQPLPEMLDSYTWARVQNETTRNAGISNVFSEQHIERIIAFQNEDWDYLRSLMPNWPEGADITTGALPVGNQWDTGQTSHANIDWWDVNYGHSINQKHDLSFQGGTKSATYYFSGGYLSQSGVINYVSTDIFERMNLLGKVNLEIADWWNFSWEGRITKKYREKPNMDSDQGDYDFMFRMMSSLNYPITPMYDGWGNYLDGHTLHKLTGGTDRLDEMIYWNTFKTNISPIKGWTINANFAYNSSASIESDEEKNSITYHVDNTPYIAPHTTPNSINRVLINSHYWTTNIFSNYEFDINTVHNFNIMAGMQFEKGKSTFLNGYKINVISSDVYSLQTATGDPMLSESLAHNATEGFFSRINYNYAEKYLFEANARYDGSYVFREGNRWGFFPSISLGWNIHKESFWTVPEKYISTLKIRGSWGQLGNQNINPYSDLELIPLSTGKLNWIFNYGSTRPMGYASAPRIVNKNLTWETVTTKNIGLNLGTLDNKLQVDFDLFERITTEMVGPSEALPGVLGANVPSSNNASLQTKGWELTLNWRDNIKRDFSYFLTLNLYDYKSIVTKYLNPTGTLSTWYEGQELGEIWGYTVFDLFRSQEEVDLYLANTDLSRIATIWNPGDLRYEDINDDGKVNNGTNTISDHGDLSIIGNSEPHWQYGITMGFDFKGLDFSMLWKGVAKKDAYFSQWSTLLWGFSQNWWEASLTTDHLDYFRDEPGTKYVGLYEGDANLNLDAFWPRPYRGAYHEVKNKNHPNTRYLQDASYLRLQNIQLGFTFPKRMLQKLYLQNLRIYFSGENILTFSKLPKMIDPVAPLGWAPWGGQYGKQGSGRLTYGADRIYSLGVTITY